jgi:hypothetical protein
VSQSSIKNNQRVELMEVTVPAGPWTRAGGSGCHGTINSHISLVIFLIAPKWKATSPHGN